jgi:potassium/hydrogen antiporter
MPSTEVVCLIAAGLLLASVFASKVSNKVGIPALLFFLLIGWLVGTVGGISLKNPAIAKFIGDFALIFILFSGGLGTDQDLVSFKDFQELIGVSKYLQIEQQFKD